MANFINDTMMILRHEVETSKQLKLYFLRHYVYLCQASVSFAYRFATSLSSLYNFRWAYKCTAGSITTERINEIQNMYMHLTSKLHYLTTYYGCNIKSITLNITSNGFRIFQYLLEHSNLCKSTLLKVYYHELFSSHAQISERTCTQLPSGLSKIYLKHRDPARNINYIKKKRKRIFA